LIADDKIGPDREKIGTGKYEGPHGVPITLEIMGKIAEMHDVNNPKMIWFFCIANLLVEIASVITSSTLVTKTDRKLLGLNRLYAQLYETQFRGERV
jgi:hypothetical protein